jgi:hypothetical protein
MGEASKSRIDIRSVSASPPRRRSDLVLSPVALAQALMVKRRLTVPPVPAGTAHGRFGAGAGPTFCLTVVGDSTAAGCGVRSHRSAMVGNLCAW